MDKMWIFYAYNIDDYSDLPSLFSVETVGFSCAFVGSSLRYFWKKQDHQKINSRGGFCAHDLIYALQKGTSALRPQILAWLLPYIQKYGMENTVMNGFSRFSDPIHGSRRRNDFSGDPT